MNRPNYRTDLLHLVPKQRRCAEIGVFRGDFAEQILEICEPSALLLIDGWDTIEHNPADTNGELHDCRDVIYWQKIRAAVESRFRDQPTVELLCGSSLAIMATQPPASIDFLYLDAAHTRREVTADLAAAAELIAPGGLLGGHDYCQQFPGVMRAVEEFLKQRPDFAWLALTRREEFPSYLLRRRRGA